MPSFTASSTRFSVMPEPGRARRPGRRRHHDREAAALRTVRRLAFDPPPLLRLPDSSPAGERMAVELLRHHPERGDIPHHTIDPFREVPARGPMLHSGHPACGVAQGQLFPPGRGTASVGRMIHTFPYGTEHTHRHRTDAPAQLVRGRAVHRRRRRGCGR